MLMTRRILCGFLGNEGMERMDQHAIDYNALSPRAEIGCSITVVERSKSVNYAE